ncbi:YbaK/EbsC family protein, partial [Streptomyces microflavus]
LDAPERFDTPGIKTIENLTKAHGVPADRQIKTLVYMVGGQLTLALLRGDHALVEQKLIDTTGSTDVRPATPDEIKAALGAYPGSLGGVGVRDLPILADQALRGRRDMVTGANVDKVHVRGVDVERDIAVGTWADLREVVAGEPCPTCGTGLEVEQTVEIGHIFKLGYKYTEALGVNVLGADGERVTPIMGSYGIGVERAMAAVVETHHDKNGIVWPIAVAPFEVAVALLDVDDEKSRTTAEEIHTELLRQRVDTILDDRAERPGVKFKDIELVGIPFRVTVGARSLAEGNVEIVSRASGEKALVPVAEAVEYVRKLVLDAS